MIVPIPSCRLARPPAAPSRQIGRGFSGRPPRWLEIPLSALAAAVVGTVVVAGALCQEPPGCKLLDRVLQCAPGVSVAPLQRIPILLAGSGKEQGSLSAQAPSLTAAPLMLEGRAQEGAWLRASVGSPGLEPLPDSAYHWYHKPPGRLRWELIPGASGPAYQLQLGDMAYEVMVLVALPSPGGSRRLISNALGPVMALGASSP